MRFFVTGNPKQLDPDQKRQLPANVTLTGFLSIPAYGGLLTAAHAVLAGDEYRRRHRRLCRGLVGPGRFAE